MIRCRESEYSKNSVSSFISRCSRANLLHNCTLMSIALNQALDENDPQLVAAAATALSSVSCTVFPEVLEVGNLSAKRICSDYRTVNIPSLLSLIDTNLRQHYIRNQGRQWQKEKNEEMATPGLVYILYVCDDKLVAFLSYMLTYGDDVPVLYLYEIHVDPAFQHLRVGSRLLLDFHQLAHTLQSPETPPLLRCKATMLTVFTDNTRALQWYFGLGYTLADDSPTDRKLRKHTVVPEYYILKR